MTQDILRILVLQHIPLEHPGVFRDFFAEDGVQWDAVELDEGEPIPELRNYDGLWVMGGPMDVWEEEQYPWLKQEKIAIRQAVLDYRLPYLGVCLGHQLLADALGGEVGPSQTPEIGVLEVRVTQQGRESAYLKNLPEVTKCLQWHGAEVTTLPQDAEILASTERCRVQAMAVGGNALGIQFHVEITPTTVSEWGAVPAYKSSLEQNLGPDALSQFDTEAKAHMNAFNKYARQLFRNWMSVAFGG
ncbi:MAG: type 1 glutamine amidotransferase [Gammaproteobacteria bacterium]|nr:type 1 glutamine amidotransferase [Gammaproteobacteria bacterium]